MEILNQLGNLVLGSIPTMVVFVVLVVAYRFLVHKPLHEVLQKRRRLTVGAMEESKQAIAAAELKTEEYEARLRLVRQDIGMAREQRVAQWATERNEVLSAAQERAQLRVKTARLEMEQGVRDAQATIAQSAEALARQILAAILPRETAR